MSRWLLSHSADPDGRRLADRHYNRQSKGATQFAPPGEKVVLVSKDLDAVWVTLNQKPEFTAHDWGEAWVNSLFRNESEFLSSELIIEALAISKWFWEPPLLGCVSFVDSSKIESKNPGYCNKMAGFIHDGYTQGGLDVLRLPSRKMPKPMRPKLKCGACDHKNCEIVREDRIIGVMESISVS